MESSVGHSVFKKIHYVITFDEETAGYRKYEYRAENMSSAEKYVGDRYLVLFNDIENPKLIQKEDILVDNIILLLFFFSDSSDSDIPEEALPKDCRSRKASGTGHVSEG